MTYETKQKPGVKGDKYFISCTFKREYTTRNSFLKQRLMFGTEKEKKKKKKNKLLSDCLTYLRIAIAYVVSDIILETLRF